jgi:hypothetical protein
MIEFSAVEVTIGKRAINKCDPNTITSGKITIDELTRLKFFEIHFFFAISGVLVGGIKEIGCHIEVLVVVGAKLLISDGINTKRYFYVFLVEIRRLCAARLFTVTTITDCVENYVNENTK